MFPVIVSAKGFSGRAWLRVIPAGSGVVVTVDEPSFRTALSFFNFFRVSGASTKFECSGFLAVLGCFFALAILERFLFGLLLFRFM